MRSTIILGLVCLMSVGAVAQDADIIFRNGIVLSMDPDDTVHEAVAIKDGEILAAGSNAKIMRHAGNGTRIRDLDGRALLPGFVDAHGHFPLSGANALYTVDLSGPPVGDTRTMQQLLDKLRAQAERTPAGEWIIGMSYDDTMLEEQRHPTRYDLDTVSPDHPIFVVHSSLHIASANSAALAFAGITRDSPQPDGGLIRMDPETGEPDGVLEELPAFGQIYFRLPKRSRAMELDAINYAAYEYAAQGVTTAQNSLAQPNEIAHFNAAAEAGVLPIRLIVLPAYQAAMAEIDGHLEIDRGHEPQVFIGGAKIIHDGSIQGYTGYLARPYHTPFHGDADYRGYPARSREELAAIAKKLHGAGWQLAIHANGDAAIDDVLAVFGDIRAGDPEADARPIIIHAQMAREDQLDAMASLRMVPSFFVLHTYYWGDRHRDVFMGPERAARISPTASALAKDVRFTIHCDTPVVPMEPLRLVWSAVNRKTVNGQLLGAEQRISVIDALRATTIDAAYQHFLEDEIGSIEAGKFADLVILSEDPRTYPHRLDRVQVLETIVAGNTVYRRDEWSN